jgi:hypothetical protein
MLIWSHLSVSANGMRPKPSGRAPTPGPSSLIGAGLCRGRSQSRWSARSEARTYDLDCDLCAAAQCPARGGRPGHWCSYGHRGCVTAGGRAGDGCWVTAVRAAARAGALSRKRQRAKLPRQLRRDSPRPRLLTAQHSPDRSAHPCACCPRRRTVWPGPDGPARRRRALDLCEESPHPPQAAGRTIRRSRQIGRSASPSDYEGSGESNRAHVVRVVGSPAVPQSVARARTMSSPWWRVELVLGGVQGPPLSSISIRA